MVNVVASIEWKYSVKWGYPVKTGCFDHPSEHPTSPSAKEASRMFPAERGKKWSEDPLRGSLLRGAL